MGVLAPRSAHVRPSAPPPIDASGNFLMHVSVDSPLNISPNWFELFLNDEIQCFIAHLG